MGTKRNTGRPFIAAASSLLALIVVVAGTAAAYMLQPVSINNGGARTTSANHVMAFSVGQPFNVTLPGVSVEMGVGFWYLVNPTGSSAVSDVPPLTYQTDLFQNAPNPFNPSTTIRFTIGQAGPGALRIYDVKGRLVATLVDEDLQVGLHELVFQPRGLASGVYLCQLKTADRTLTRRLMLVK